MTFKLKDFKPGDIVRTEQGNVGEVHFIGRALLHISFGPGKKFIFHPAQIVEIEQVMVGERKIGI